MPSLPPRRTVRSQSRSAISAGSRTSGRRGCCGRVCTAGAALADLARSTEEHLHATLGIAAESRPYEPHLTLARIKNPVPLQRLRAKVREMQPAALGSFTVTHFVLYRSAPGSNASIYHKLSEYRFESVAAAGKI